MGRSVGDPTDGRGAGRSKRPTLDKSGLRTSANPSPPPGLILIVEDAPLVAGSQVRAAGRMGARSHVEASVDGAYAFLAENDVAGMLIDVNLGDGGDGLDFLRRAREDLESFVAAMVLSGMSDDQFVLAPCRLGAIYRAKPGNGAELRRFFRVVARWPVYRARLERIFRYFERPKGGTQRLTEWHMRLVQQYLFFGRESLDERLGVSRGTRKRLQKPLLDALGIESIKEIWAVLSLCEDASDTSLRNLFGSR